ncbi:MAG: hypothetical protein LBI33_14545 [Propionibacteriaceae bacterium]|jgi:hypothetical protein|nr:hypothetical protein [Propionibacteriaceae bacterium]
MDDTQYEELTGNPFALDEMTQEYATLAEDIRASRTALLAFTENTSFKGEAADSVRMAAASYDAAFGAVAAVQDGIASALTAYRYSLELAQSVADPAARQIDSEQTRLVGLAASEEEALSTANNAFVEWSEAQRRQPWDEADVSYRARQWATSNQAYLNACAATESCTAEIARQKRIWEDGDGKGAGKALKDAAAAVACDALGSVFAGANIVGADGLTAMGGWTMNIQDIITAAKSGELTDEQWAALIAAASSGYGEWLAATLFNNLSPEEVARLAQGLSDLDTGTSSAAWGEYVGAGGPLSYVDWLAQKQQEYSDRIDALGVLLGGASRSERHPLIGSWAETAAVTLTTSPYAPALSLVLSHGQYGTTFATTVGAGVLDAYIDDPTLEDWSTKCGVLDVDGNPWHTDPLVGVMNMLATNLDAAQAVFGSGGVVPVTIDGQTVSVNARLNEALTGHDWAMSDNGDALGKALGVATTEHRVPLPEPKTDPQSWVSASITSQLVTIVGERTRASDDWEMPEGMRDDFARIGSVYMPDVFDAVANRGEAKDLLSGWVSVTSSQFPGFPPGAKFTVDDITAILATLGENMDDVAVLSAGWAATSNALLANCLQVAYATPDGRAAALNSGAEGVLKNHVNLAAQVLDTILAGAVAGGENEKAKAAQKAVLEKQILDFALSIPVPGLGKAAGISTLIDWLVSQAKTQSVTWAKQEIDQATKVSSGGDIGAYSAAMHTSAVDQVVAAMYAAGFWDEETMAALAKIDPTGVQAGPPSSAFKSDGTFDTASDAYTTWLIDNMGLTSDIQEIFGQ